LTDISLYFFSKVVSSIGKFQVRYLKLNSLVGLPNVLQQQLVVLADEGLLVVAGDIVPHDAVLVDVVEDSHAGLAGLVDVVLGVVWLGTAEVALGGPGLCSPAWGSGVGGGHLGVGVGPEPTEDIDGLQVSTIRASLEVTETTAGPDVGDVASLHEFKDHVVLSLSLHPDGVHATHAALVARLQPVYLLALGLTSGGVGLNADFRLVP